MKRLLPFLLCLILAVISCKDKNKGTVKINDDKTNKIQKLFEALEKKDSVLITDLVSDSFKFYPPDSASTISEGKKEFIAALTAKPALKDGYNLIKSYSIDKNQLNMETQYNTDGEINTRVWSNWRLTGMISNSEYTVPLYINFKWANDKILTASLYYDQSFLYKEKIALDDIYNKTVDSAKKGSGKTQLPNWNYDPDPYKGAYDPNPYDNKTQKKIRKQLENQKK